MSEVRRRKTEDGRLKLKKSSITYHLSPIINHPSPMIILGSTSEVAQAFVEKALVSGEKFAKIYFITSNKQNTERFAKHIDVKYLQQSEIIEADLTKEINYNIFDGIDSDLLFCATGYLGLGTEEGLYDDKNTEKIIDINYEIGRAHV